MLYGEMFARAVTLVCAVISLCACGSGSRPTSRTPTADDPVGSWPPIDGTVHGTILSRDGQPLDGICVATWDEQDDGEARTIRTRTDALGRYETEGTVHTGSGSPFHAPTRVEVWDCTSEGAYANAFAYGLEPPFREPADFTLGPSMTISGRVVDEDGEPVAGMCVAAHDGRASVRYDFYRAVANELTDADGTFLVTGLGDSPKGTTVSAGFCEGQDRYQRQLGGVDTGQGNCTEPSSDIDEGERWVSFQEAQDHVLDLVMRPVSIPMWSDC